MDDKIILSSKRVVLRARDISKKKTKPHEKDMKVNRRLGMDGRDINSRRYGLKIT